MTAAELIMRAKLASGHFIKYKLGSGGMDPNSELPSNINNECDCSGYVCWCLKISRHTNHPLYVKLNDGWINTDSVVYDAEHPTGYFYRIEKPKVGCLVVYPSPAPGKYGHIGIVTQVTQDKETNSHMAQVIHCSSGNYRKFDDAIKETGPEAFSRPGTIFAWYIGIE